MFTSSTFQLYFSCMYQCQCIKHILDVHQAGKGRKGWQVNSNLLRGYGGAAAQSASAAIDPAWCCVWALVGLNPCEELISITSWLWNMLFISTDFCIFFCSIVFFSALKGLLFGNSDVGHRFPAWTFPASTFPVISWNFKGLWPSSTLLTSKRMAHSCGRLWSSFLTSVTW